MRSCALSLDQLSNNVPKLLEEGKFDEAEQVCRQLTQKYPEQIDGMHRYAEVYEAKGDRIQAAQYYRKAAEFAKQMGGFGDETITFFFEKADRLADGAEK